MQPVRTALFAPGIKERVMSKALESGADAVILDLEDSVPVAAKAEARTLVAGHEAVARTARALFPLADKAGDEPTADLLTQRLTVHEQTAWMLRSLLED